MKYKCDLCNKETGIVYSNKIENKKHWTCSKCNDQIMKKELSTEKSLR